METLDHSQYRTILEKLIANYGTVYNQDGLMKNRQQVVELLMEAGFEIIQHERKGAANVMVAKRHPRLQDGWIGLYGHYDVEPLEDGWLTDPLVLTEVEARWFGRGIGDNLGPLALRLLAAVATRDLESRPGILWLFQGEEEVASPFAHEVFPTLELPVVKYWLEETGYFNAARGQRYLVMNPNADLENLLGSLKRISQQFGFEHYQENRYMNKAFGQHQCPYLNHIVRDHAYIAIGPNDDNSNIHAPNESLPLATMGVSYSQILEVMKHG